MKFPYVFVRKDDLWIGEFEGKNFSGGACCEIYTEHTPKYDWEKIVFSHLQPPQCL